VIVTVTPNPSIDRTLTVPVIRRGEVIRATTVSDEAGGKGINVARALVDMGHDASAVVPASRSTASRLRDLVGQRPPLEVVPIEGAIRVNLSLVEPDGTVTKVNEPGPTLSEAETERLIDAVARTVAGDASVEWVVGCGSLPPGAPEDFYGRLIDRLGPAVRVAVDADRGALRSAVAHRPGLIKPNRAELAELVGTPLATLGDVVDAASELTSTGVGRVLVSLGSDGAVVVDATGTACHATAAIDDVANPVGAGDALLAGFLAGGADVGALPSAVAWSVAACRAAGTRMPPVTPRDEAVVVVRPTIERALVLAP
jgi:1-phosphofructokinase family hexose kinase